MRAILYLTSTFVVTLVQTDETRWKRVTSCGRGWLDTSSRSLLRLDHPPAVASCVELQLKKEKLHSNRLRGLCSRTTPTVDSGIANAYKTRASPNSTPLVLLPSLPKGSISARIPLFTRLRILDVQLVHPLHRHRSNKNKRRCKCQVSTVKPFSVTFSSAAYVHSHLEHTHLNLDPATPRNGSVCYGTT